ncbi:uncharacterized protein LOC117610278 [Osmia lignaria lignaria]|uniref:uncharacterized protein LOC117610278 n=1 Tax=Osmia lignaria lignaria TaxID=1437193 RepID=UPI00147927E9|nr:uncharacterized protein LOC117610278 [Osmia lignaria]
MSDHNKDVVLKINKINLELRKKLEMVSKWRVECAQLQLEFLKLYTPECLEILESFKQTMDTTDNIDSTNNKSSI